MFSFFRNLLSPAGGLSYHMTAWKQARSTWNPFRQRLSLCLENWEIKNDHLLLIGASGGYTLTDSFLQNFQKITCIDPDPLAPFFFRHRFSNDNIHWNRRDYFSKPLSTKNSHHFETLLTHYPNSSILFCNILGQLPLLYPKQCPEDYSLWLRGLSQYLNSQQISWATYHDLFSTALPLHSHACSIDLSSSEDEEVLLKKFFNFSKNVIIHDHQTKNWLSEYPRTLIPWPLRKNQNHLIEVFLSR